MHDLRTAGPLVLHVKGRVTQVFGTSQRPRPSFTPLVAALVLLAISAALPYILAWLPIIVLVLIAAVWLRLRFRLSGPRWRAQRRERDPGLQVTSFRVQVYSDDHRPVTTLDCRLVQDATSGPPPLVGDEDVIGQGVRFGRGPVDLSRLRIGAQGGTRLRAAFPKSSTAVLLPTVAVLGAAGLLVYTGWEAIAAFDPNAVLDQVISVIIGVVVLVVLAKMLRWFLRF